MASSVCKLEFVIAAANWRQPVFHKVCVIIAPEAEAQRSIVLLATSIQLCHDTGFTVVAEGVEIDAQLARQCSADIIQGHLGRPIPSHLICDLLASRDDLHRPHNIIQQSHTEKHLSP